MRNKLFPKAQTILLDTASVKSFQLVPSEKHQSMLIEKLLHARSHLNLVITSMRKTALSSFADGGSETRGIKQLAQDHRSSEEVSRDLNTETLK